MTGLLNHVTLSGQFDHDLNLILSYVSQGLGPGDVQLERGEGMFAGETSEPLRHGLSIPEKLYDRLLYLSHHSGPETWQTIFSVVHLWHSKGAASLSDIGHPVVIAAKKLSGHLHYESHKLKAYLRFREVMTEDGVWYVSYHSCDHNVLPLVSDFLVDRFRTIRWQITTKHCSARWSGTELIWGKGGSPSQKKDDLDDLWRTFYKSTHNPDRLNTQLFKRHVPKKYWQDMPELAVVGSLLAADGHEAEETATPDVQLPLTMSDLRAALTDCRRCDLWQHATQVVSGRGPEKAAIMIVGEQPGDQEDLAGAPFVGPAGQELRKLAAGAGLNLDECYLTNAVKHFRYEAGSPGGKPRIHKRPGAGHIATCRSWLDAEIRMVDPALIICLGATAVRGVIGYPLKMSDHANQLVKRADGRAVLVALHPAAILRAEGERQDTLRKSLLAGLLSAANWQKQMYPVAPD